MKKLLFLRCDASLSILPIALVAATLLLWPSLLHGQSALVAKISSDTQTTTLDQSISATLEGGHSYWVVGCDGKGGYVVLHGSGAKVILPKDVHFRVIGSGKYDEATPIRIDREKATISRTRGTATYEATLDNAPSGAFVAVQVLADGKPCGTGVERVTGKSVFVSVDFDTSEGSDFTYTAYYFLDGNELHQVKSSD